MPLISHPDGIVNCGVVAASSRFMKLGWKERLLKSGSMANVDMKSTVVVVGMTAGVWALERVMGDGLERVVAFEERWCWA